MEETVEWVQVPEVADSYEETVSYEHLRAGAHVNSR